MSGFSIVDVNVSIMSVRRRTMGIMSEKRQEGGTGAGRASSSHRGCSARREKEGIGIVRFVHLGHAYAQCVLVPRCLSTK